MCLVTLVYCGQTAGWIKMLLGTKVGLSPGDIVLDGTHLIRRKRAQQPPLFGPCLLYGQTIVWIKIPLGMEVGPDTGDSVLDGIQLSP